VRHWSLPAVLNRAGVGKGDGTGAITEGLARRAHYAVIFEKAGKAELATWGQLAIDTGDAILADSVYRANGARSKEDRGFEPTSLLSKLRNDDYKTAQAALEAVEDLAVNAKRLIDAFHERTNAVNLEQSKRA